LGKSSGFPPKSRECVDRLAGNVEVNRGNADESSDNVEIACGDVAKSWGSRDRFAGNVDRGAEYPELPAESDDVPRENVETSFRKLVMTTAAHPRSPVGFAPARRTLVSGRRRASHPSYAAP
jgi:hypothetical protein